MSSSSCSNVKYVLRMIPLSVRALTFGYGYPVDTGQGCILILCYLNI